MPWTPKQFKERHAHGLTPRQARTAAAQANAILKSGGDEGVAIATAIKHAKASSGQRLYGGKK